MSHVYHEDIKVFCDEFGESFIYETRMHCQTCLHGGNDELVSLLIRIKYWNEKTRTKQNALSIFYQIRVFCCLSTISTFAVAFQKEKTLE